MSEVKHELCVVYPATLGYETDYRPATTAEIMEAHPKCGECICFNHHNSHCTCIDYPTFGVAMNPTTDYCRHWEGKG